MGKQRNIRANLKFFSKPKGVFSVNELYSLLDFEYTRQKQKSLNIWNMSPPKRAPISKTKVAKYYKNSLTKWLHCHTVLSHRSPGSLCYTDKGNLFDPLHPNNSKWYSEHWSLHISNGNDKEKLFDNLELLKLVTIFIILITLTFDSRVKLWWEIRSQSLLGVKWLIIKSFFSWWSFPLFSWPLCVIQGWYC